MLRRESPEARVWLAMRNAHQRGYWYEKAPAHE